MNLRDKRIEAILQKRSGFSSADLRQTDGDGRTPLIRAVLLGDVELVRAMLEAGADIDETDYNGDTALAHANRADFGEVGRLLVEWGADAEHRNFSGRAAGVPTVSATSKEMANSAQGSAATAGDRDEVTQERSRESVSDLRESVLAEAATRMRPTIAQPTQDLIDSIKGDEYNWSEIQLASVDIPRIVHHLLERDSGLSVNLYDDTLTTWMHLLTAIAEIDRRWMEATVTKLDPNIYHATWFAETWEPRVLWNGAVLVRNGHRVLGILYSETVFFDESTRETILQEIGRLGENGTIISERDGTVWYVSDAERINLNGNNIVFIRDTDALESNTVLTAEFLSDTAEQSRYGIVALRVFRTGMHLYGTFRDDDELDFVVDSGTLAPVDWANGDEVQIHELAAYALPDTFRPDLGTLNRSSQDVEMWKRERAKSTKILHEAIRPEFLESHIDSVDGLPEYSRMETSGVLNAVVERLCDSMGREIETRVLGAPKIFADGPEKIRGYTGSYAAASVSPDVADHVVILFFVPEEDDDSTTDLTAIADTAEIEHVLRHVEPRAEDVSFEIAIPASVDEWGPWVPIDPTNVSQLKKRVTEIATTEDRPIDEVIEGQFLRCRFRLPNLARIELDEFGKAFGEELAGLVDSEAVIIGESFTILVPSMGIDQSFYGPDVDSGNAM